MLWRLISVHLFVYFLLDLTQGELSLCCLQTRSAACTQNCRKLLKQRKHTHISKRLSAIVATCPRSETDMWSCLKNSQQWKDFREASEKKPYFNDRSHSVCCKEATHISCEAQCLTTKNVTKLHNENCDANREPKFAQCVFKVQASQSCCADTKNKDCMEACTKYFKNSRTDSVLVYKVDLEKKCGRKSKQFQCAMNESEYQSVIQEFANCCSKKTSRKCEQSCRQALRNPADFDRMFEYLSESCGQFSIQVPLYKCFLENAHTINTGPEDSHRVVETERTVSYTNFKYQCCARAKSKKCRQWCLKTIRSPEHMGLWDNMYLTCIQNPKEVELSTCMSDVLEPCEIGGKAEMKFCSNFNNRPLDLFRRCNQFGDGAAQKLFQFWADGIVHVFDYKLIFKDINKCYPERFKAMACLLAVRPCSHNVPQMQVCRSDCEELLGKCLDKQLTKISETPIKKVCEAILPNNNQTNCISVNDYIHKPNDIVHDKATLPCENNPCKEDEICMLQQSCNSPKCEPYICVKGCPVSRQSKLRIPVHQLAKLAVNEKNKECHAVCECKLRHPLRDPSFTVFENCKKFGCHEKRNCTVKNEIYHDGEVFMNECNTCTCHDGHTICTKKFCGNRIDNSNDRSRRNDQLFNVSKTPCNCGTLYRPVCGVNGMTFPNACVGRCFTLKDDQLDVGDCQAIDPCNPNQCAQNSKCMPKRRVCLSHSSHCPQYTCHYEDPEPYFRRPKECDKNSPVCGYDGVTYQSQCLAEKSGTGVDYEGPCIPSHLADVDVYDRCKKIKCPSVGPSNCKLVVPPGSCCPVCGSILRILYSQKDLSNHQNYVRIIPITVADVIHTMRQLQQVSGCKLYGHLTVEGDLMMLLTVNTVKHTKTQILACTTEAQRLNKYINNQSPMVTANYYLSILKASRVSSTKWTAYSSSMKLFNRTKDFASLILCILFCYIVNR